jgi:hypothetical protein
MKCPYQINLGCPYIDTAVMDKLKECPECENYGKGVRPTGAMPVLGWIVDKFKRKKEVDIDEWNTFMMNL